MPDTAMEVLGPRGVSANDANDVGAAAGKFVKGETRALGNGEPNGVQLLETMQHA